jgi:hypothetical protein
LSHIAEAIFAADQEVVARDIAAGGGAHVLAGGRVVETQPLELTAGGIDEQWLVESDARGQVDPALLERSVGCGAGGDVEILPGVGQQLVDLAVAQAGIVVATGGLARMPEAVDIRVGAEPLPAVEREDKIVRLEAFGQGRAVELLYIDLVGDRGLPSLTRTPSLPGVQPIAVRLSAACCGS